MRELTYSTPRPRTTKQKPGPTAKARAKRRRAESPVLRSVREFVDDRDGYCRFAAIGPCEGPSQLAHLEDKKRARTRGMKPEQRHTTGGTAKACERHHRQYDAGTIRLALSDLGANGPIRVKYQGRVVVIP